MANASEFIDDVRRYDAGASEEAVGKIVKHLGIALQRNDAGGLTDSGLVAATDQTELDRVRDKWGVAKLGLDEGSAALIVSKVAEEKSRQTTHRIPCCGSYAGYGPLHAR